MIDSYQGFKVNSPPVIEGLIEIYGEEVVVGIWETEGMIGYAIKKANGYNAYEIHWLPSQLFDMIEIARKK